MSSEEAESHPPAEKRLIVGVCGFAGAGKNTFANVLVENHGFVAFSFADSLKNILSELFGWDRSLLEGDTPESRAWREKAVDVEWSSFGVNFTPRKAMQKIGTDLFRKHLNENIWALVLKNKILKSPHQKIVITDFRFVNEVETIAAIPDTDFVVFDIVRDEPWWYEHVKQKVITECQFEAFKTKIPDIHESEYEWIWALNLFQGKIKNYTIYNREASVEGAKKMFKEKIAGVLQFVTQS